MNGRPEIVICSAIRMPDEYIVRGHRHNDAIHTAMGMPRYQYLMKAKEPLEQGFMTSCNRFVDRREGCILQKAAGIESYYVTHRGNPSGAYLNGELYSEDLY